MKSSVVVVESACKRVVFQDILLEDRVAFACMYLTDLPLNAYINRLSGDLIAKGDLEGILVVGLSTNAGVELLQNYLDKVRSKF